MALAAGTIGSSGVASAAPGPGTFTQITTPHQTLRFDYRFGATNSFPVAGRTSPDVTTVDVVCVTFIVGSATQIAPLASGVPVTGGQFSATAVFPSSVPTTNCRLRAIPAGVDPSTDYLGSYTGPIVYASGMGITRDGGSVPYSYTAYAEEGDGVALLTDAGSCGANALVTVEAPQMVAGPIVISCAFSLPAGNLDPSGSPTRSAIRIDGHNAYLPSGVHSELINTQGLSVTQPALSVHRKVAHNGDTTITETATLMRCSNGNAYPPTSTSCPTLVATGVRFTRISTVFRDGHQVKIRDSFTSTDHHAHSATLQYQATAENETGGGTATGNVGYAYPRHTSRFHPAGFGQRITGLGKKAGTMFVRSDLRARSDDPTADTLAESWSRAPSTIFYSTIIHDAYGLQTSVDVPKSGAGQLGFALSERWSTADVKALAALATADMMPPPRITSPADGGHVNGTSTHVTGKLAAGANGLPITVKVNGHRAKITRHGPSAATFAVTFTEPLGTHKLKVTATDLAGNTRSASVKIHNT